MTRIFSILKLHYPRLIISLIFTFIFLYLLELSPSDILVILIITTVIIISIIIRLDYLREQQIIRIRETIKDIRHDKLSSPGQVHLGPELESIEREIKKMFNRMEDDISNLKKLEKVRTQFLGNVSHELRTPIFAIQGYLETLVNGAIYDPEVNLKFLQKAYTHTNNLNNLLNELIDISMIESGEMKMNYGYFEIIPFLDKIIHEFHDEAREKGIEIRFEAADKQIKYYCDIDKLRQVMVNLLSNAIKYTENGFVEVKLSDEEKFGVITVSDSGIGIPEKDINRIFERFYRVDKDRSREVGGTGLGLAIVKHIVEAHGSVVNVESQPNEGTKFSFKLKKQFVA
jgi:two-component system phosphate regulon sensor histidine kinase PhoR